MSTEIKRGRGRPKKNTPKYDQPVKVNLTQKQADRLEFRQHESRTVIG